MSDDKAAEATPDVATSEVVTEVNSEVEIKEEVTPETPVTEPLTNGSSTPESPKVESPPPAEEPAPAPVATVDPAPTPVAAAEPAPAEPAVPVVASPEPERQEPKPEIQPEQLPVNGLSLEETKAETPEVTQTEECKPEEVVPTAEKIEIVPAPEIPVKKEVCVEQMPLESTPPPLPVNPPPSSVASFAATTMAPELTDASLANTAELVISAPHSTLDTKPETLHEDDAPIPPTDLTNADTIHNTENKLINEVITTEVPIPLKEINDVPPTDVEPEEKISTENIKEAPVAVLSMQSNVTNNDIVDTLNQATGDQSDSNKILLQNLVEISNKFPSAVEESNKNEIEHNVPEPQEIYASLENKIADVIDDDLNKVPEELHDTNLDSLDDLPPPPPPIEDEVSLKSDLSGQDIGVASQNKIDTAPETNEIITNSNHILESRVNAESFNGTEEKNVKNKTKDTLETKESAECNGTLESVTKEERAEDSWGAASPELSAPPSLSESAVGGSADGSEAFPPPPTCAELLHADPAQEPIAVSDKLSDLIPEVPVVPDLKNETETSSDVAMVN